MVCSKVVQGDTTGPRCKRFLTSSDKAITLASVTGEHMGDSVPGFAISHTDAVIVFQIKGLRLSELDVVVLVFELVIVVIPGRVRVVRPYKVFALLPAQAYLRYAA